MREIKQIHLGSPAYPELLKTINDPPQTLYALGNLELLSCECIAVVGTRRASPYGRWAGKEIGKRIARCGLCVVSGMAEGIDAAAHWGCLDAGGPSIAVLGTGVDRCFPKSNEKLYDRLLSDGLLISELPPGVWGKAYHFPRRNRIISGLSRSVVVVEGAVKSGSMITAGFALEQGRDVFAVPGNINQPNSYGVNKLIADGAFPILDMDELPETLGIGCVHAKAALEQGTLTDEEKDILLCIIEAPGCGREYVSMKTGMAAALTVTMLMSLELKGLIRSDGDKYYVD